MGMMHPFDCVIKKIDLVDVLNRFYKAEKNVKISCFWDAGWHVSIGDYLNGYTDTQEFDNLDSLTVYLDCWYKDNLTTSYPLWQSNNEGSGPLTLEQCQKGLDKLKKAAIIDHSQSVQQTSV